MVIVPKPPSVAKLVRATPPKKAVARVQAEIGLEQQMETARRVMKSRRNVLRMLEK